MVVGLDRDGDQVVDGILVDGSPNVGQWTILIEEAVWTFNGFDFGGERTTREGSTCGITSVIEKFHTLCNYPTNGKYRCATHHSIQNILVAVSKTE